MIHNSDGTVLYKPAYWEDAGLFCCKTVSVFPLNATTELPVTAGVIVANDGHTGMPVAMMDAGFITSLRTGAATGLATRLLARVDATNAALFGVGGQAAHQLEALLCARPLTRIYVHASKIESAARFCEQQSGRYPDCELLPAEDRDHLPECEVIATATTSPTPLFAQNELHSAVHISAIGSLGVSRRELDGATVAFCDTYVDQREACLAEAGEFLLAEQEGELPQPFKPLELGELLLNETVEGQPLPGEARQPGNRPTLFKSVGNAAQDIVCVREVLAVAQRLGLGSNVTL